MNDLSPSFCIVGLLLFAAIATRPSLVEAADPPRPVVKVVEGGESRLKPEDVLTTVLGPGVNQPDPYPGYGGFVGWVSPIRLRNGDWVGLRIIFSTDGRVRIRPDYSGIDLLPASNS